MRHQEEPVERGFLTLFPLLPLLLLSLLAMCTSVHFVWHNTALNSFGLFKQCGKDTHSSFSVVIFLAKRCLKTWSDCSSLFPAWQLKGRKANKEIPALATCLLQHGLLWLQGCSFQQNCRHKMNNSFAVTSYRHFGQIQPGNSSLIMPFAHSAGNYCFLLCQLGTCFWMALPKAVS